MKKLHTPNPSQEGNVGKDTVISYTYDGLGNRISKSMKLTENGNTTSEDFTYYIRDVQGNILSTYSKTGASLVLDEQMLYSSDLLGVWKTGTSTSLSNPGGLLQNNYPNFYSRKIGNKQYSIKDHLGNVRVTFADVKIPSNNLLQDFVLETQSVSTYYPFGWEVKPLSWAFESFKFGFNGQEKSSEISSGNYTAKFWEYDSRIGKRWNIDPKPNTSFSPYLTFANNPVWFSDVLGDTLDIMENDQSKKDIISLVRKNKKIDNSKYITFSKGRVGLDFSGMTAKEIKSILRKDEGLKLINDLVVSGKKYLYEASDYALVGMANGFKYGFMMYKDNTGVVNASNGGKDSRNGYGVLPKLGYDGQVIIDIGAKYFEENSLGVKVVKSRASIVFHELAESYERTDNGVDYRTTNAAFGAHDLAIKREYKWFGKSNYPGEVSKVIHNKPSPNRIEKIIKIINEYKGDQFKKFKKN